MAGISQIVERDHDMILFVPQCDQCGKTFESLSAKNGTFKGIKYSTSLQALRRSLRKEGWYREGRTGKDYCPTCATLIKPRRFFD
jgi:hypothetical protein